MHAGQAEDIRRVAHDADIADPLAADAHAQHRAHIVPMPRLTEMRGQLYRREVLRRVKVLGAHIFRQEERRRPLAVGSAAGKHHGAAAPLRPFLGLIPLGGAEIPAGADRAAALGALAQILHAAQKFIFLHFQFCPVPVCICVRRSSSFSAARLSAPARPAPPAQTRPTRCAGRRNAAPRA